MTGYGQICQSTKPVTLMVPSSHLQRGGHDGHGTSRQKQHSTTKSRRQPARPGRILHHKVITRFASANVDTFLQPGRAAMVLNELSRFKIDIAGLQQLRWRDSGTINTNGYVVMFSGRSDRKGTEGVAICVRKERYDSVVSFESD